MKVANLGAADVQAAHAFRSDLSLFAEQALGLKLSRDQRKILRIMSKPGAWLSVRTAHGVGKGLALDTPLPTPTGWTTMGEVRVGDQLFDESGRVCRVTAVHPDRHIECCRVIFGDRSSIVCDEDHLWSVLDFAARGRAKSKASRHKSGPIDWRAHWDSAEAWSARCMYGHQTTAWGQLNLAIPTCLPLECRQAVLPMDPYVLGAWLGDGTTSGPSITGVDEEIFAEIRRRGWTLRFRESTARAVKCPTYGMKHGATPGVATLRATGVLGNKHIPMGYLRASRDQRMDLLRGIMDTDGFIAGTGGVGVDFCHARLAHDVVELIRTFGWKPTVRTGPTCSGSTRYRIFYRPTERVFNLPRKAQQQTLRGAQFSRNTLRTVTAMVPVPSVPTRCISVDSPRKLYLAGEAMVPTHNTYSAAALCCAFLVTHPGAKVISTAPTASQVRDLLWMEINGMVQRARGHLGGQCKTMRWDMEPGWFAVGLSVREPERIQGRHGDHILFVLDEAAGVRPEIWLAVRTMTTGMDARCLAIGNPTRVTGDFAATFKDSRWQNLRISYREAPNVTGEMHIPGGCTLAWVEDMARKFGRDSAIFKSRCEAEFPDDDADSIIPWSRVAAAMEPERHDASLAVPPGQDVRLGVDVARFGRAYSVLTARDGPRILERLRFTKSAVTETAGQVIALAEKYLIDPENIAIDDTGVGGGVTDILNERFYPRKVKAFNFGAKADDEEHYDDAATEIYWRLRDALDPAHPDALALPAGTPEADELASQLLRRYKLTSKGRMKMESKDDYQKRNPEGRSPDDADSLALTYATPAVKAADLTSSWGDDKADAKDKAALDAVFNRGHNGEDEDENEEGNPDG